MKASELNKFLQKNQSEENVSLTFSKESVEIGVNCPDFFISEKFNFTGDINGLVEVKAPEFLEVLSELKTKEITFELKEGLLYLTPDISIPVERVVEAKPQKTKNIVVIPDTALLREYAKISLVSRTKTEMPEKPYVDGLLWGGGLILLAANPAMAASHGWPLKQLKDWGASVAVSDETNVRIFLPSKAILELPEKEPLELHIGARSILMKAGTMTVKIDRFKDPLNAYIKSVFHEKAGDFRVTFDAPSTQPSRMEKLINWLDQSKAKACDMSMGPDGIWVGPRGSLKDPKTIDKHQCLQLGDIPFAGTYRVVTFSSLVIEALRHSKSEITKISFPQKKGEVLYISTKDENHGYDDVYGVVSYTEIPIAEVAEIPALIDETPIAVEQGTETLVEVPTTTAEAIKQAIAEDKIPEEMKEQVKEAVEKATEETPPAETPKKAKGKKAKENPPSDFADGAQEVGNAIVPTQPAADEAEIAKDAIKAIAETAIVEVIDPDSNVINLDPKTKKKAKAVKEAVEATKVELETEIQSESVDLNRIIALTLRLETLGGRFIEITFALHTKWYPTLTITEEVKAEARKHYPHLAA